MPLALCFTDRESSWHESPQKSNTGQHVRVVFIIFQFQNTHTHTPGNAFPGSRKLFIHSAVNGSKQRLQSVAGVHTLHKTPSPSVRLSFNNFCLCYPCQRNAAIRHVSFGVNISNKHCTVILCGKMCLFHTCTAEQGRLRAAVQHKDLLLSYYLTQPK